MAKEATIKININTQNAINSMEDLNKEFEGTLSTIGDLRMASTSLSEELESTPVGTEKFKQLQQALIDVNGQVKNYELSIESLDNEQLASEIRSVVGGIMDLAGGLTLVGVSGENLEVIAQKFAKIEGISRAATGAMDIYNSGAKVMNAILTRSAAAQGVMAAATTATGVASTGAALSVKALTAAMLSNPITAIAVAIGAVVVALVMFMDTTEEAKKADEKFAKSIDKTTDALNRRVASSLRQKEQEIDKIIALGATETEVANERMKLVGIEEDFTFKLYNANLLRISKLSKRKGQASKDAVKNLTAENKALNDKLTKDQYNMNEFDYARRDLEIGFLAFNTDKNNKLTKDEEDALKKRKEEFIKITQERNQLESDILNQHILEKEILENEYLDGQLSNETKEINAVKDKYFKLIQEAIKYNEDITTLQSGEQGEIDAITNKYDTISEITKSETEQINAEVEEMVIEHQKVLELLEADKITDEETRQEAILAIKQKYLNKELVAINNKALKDKELLTKQRDAELSNEKLTAEEKEKIRAEYTKNIVALEQEKELKIANLETESIENTASNLTEKLAKYGEMIGQIGSYITQATETLNQFLENKNQEELERIQNTSDSAKTTLQSQLDAGIISREEYGQRLKAIEEEKAAKELEIAKQAFKRQKAIQMVNATIQGAQAVLAAYAAGAAVPIIGPITTGPAYAAIAGVLAATQIGVIASQKFRASKGGKVPGSPSQVDSVDALLAPGEMVINSNSSEMFGGLLSQINQAGGGVSMAPNVGIIKPKTQPVYSENSSDDIPIRAYVVEQDMTYSQNRVQKLRNNARFS